MNLSSIYILSNLKVPFFTGNRETTPTLQISARTSNKKENRRVYFGGQRAGRRVVAMTLHLSNGSPILNQVCAPGISRTGFARSDRAEEGIRLLCKLNETKTEAVALQYQASSIDSGTSAISPSMRRTSSICGWPKGVSRPRGA